MLPVTDWFVRVKPEHPLADIKQAKKVISELPVTDSVKALEQICFWLDSIANTNDFRTDVRFQLIELLDQAAKIHQRKIGQEYLSGQRLQKIRENTLWATAIRFCKLLGASYNRCIDDFQAGSSGSSSIQKQLSNVIARTLRALTCNSNGRCCATAISTTIFGESLAGSTASRKRSTTRWPRLRYIQVSAGDLRCGANFSTQ